MREMIYFCMFYIMFLNEYYVSLGMQEVTQNILNIAQSHEVRNMIFLNVHTLKGQCLHLVGEDD